MNTHWIDEYHIDGFRFDLTKGFTQNVGGSWDAGGYDQSRIDLLKRMANVIWSVDPQSILILEHFAENAEEKNLAEYGFMLWGNMNYQYNEATMGYGSNLSWGVHSERGWPVPHLVSYMESHDEERLMFKNMAYGNSGPGGYDVTDFVTALKRMELASTFFLTLPGPKMMWQFGELGYEYSIFMCADGTVDLNDTGCKLDPKPVVWDFLGDYNRVRLYDVNKALLDLRNTYDVFHTSDYQLDLSNPNWKRIRLYDSDMDVVILGAFDMDGENITAGFPHGGTWYEYFSGESLEVTDVNMNISLAAGEYRLYTDVNIGQADVSSIYGVDKDLQALELYPNPTSNQLFVETDLDWNTVQQVRIFSVDGGLVSARSASNQAGVIDIEDLNLSNGSYLLELISSDQIYLGRFHVIR